MEESRFRDKKGAAMKDLTRIIYMYGYDEDNPVDVTTREWLGSDYYYRVLIKTVSDAERFNYQSDYWGSADEYQEGNVALMWALEPWVGTRCYIDDDEGYLEGTLEGILIDKQYNSPSHTDILFSDVSEEPGTVEAGMKKRAYRDMPKDIVLPRLQKALDDYYFTWVSFEGERDLPDMKPDYSAIFEALPDGESYLIEVVDFSETLSELYYEFPDTCYRIVERFAEAVRRDLDDADFYLEPYSGYSELVGRAWPGRNLFARKLRH